MSIPKIEIKTHQSVIPEIYADGHKMNGVMGFEMRPENLGDWPILTVDLDARDLTVDGVVISFEEIKIEFKKMLKGERMDAFD